MWRVSIWGKKQVRLWSFQSESKHVCPDNRRFGLRLQHVLVERDPADDKDFAAYVRRPELAQLLPVLYPGVFPHLAGLTASRDDLVAILLTGVPGLNFTGPRRADLLRLNTALVPGANGACYHPAVPSPPSTPSRFGVLDGDLCGYPNGRRLADDIVDIDLRAFAEGYGSILHGLLGLPNRTPNNLLGDGVDANDKPFLPHFPYVPSPHQGYEVP